MPSDPACTTGAETTSLAGTGYVTPEEAGWQDLPRFDVQPVTPPIVPAPHALLDERARIAGQVNEAAAD